MNNNLLLKSLLGDRAKICTNDACRANDCWNVRAWDDLNEDDVSLRLLRMKSVSGTRLVVGNLNNSLDELVSNAS